MAEVEIVHGEFEKRPFADVVQPVANRAGLPDPIVGPPPLPDDDEFDRHIRRELAAWATEQERQQREFRAHLARVADRFAKRLVNNLGVGGAA